nr:cytochrome P450 [Pharsalia antennata]
MAFLITILHNILSVVVALLAVVFVWFKWRYQYWKRKNVPYIEPTIPFGNLGNRLTDATSDKLVEIYKTAKDRGWKYCGLYIFLTPILLIVDLDLMKNVLTKDFQYFTDRGIYTNEEVDTVGCNLFALNGSKWRKLRTKLSPAFTPGKLKIMTQTIVDCGLVLEKYLEENVNPVEPVDIKEVFSNFTIDMIGSCGLGLDCNSFEEPDSLFKRVGKDVCHVSTLRLILMSFAQDYPRLARTLRIPQIPKETRDYFTRIVQDTVSYREKNNVVRNDFLQLLMDMRNSKAEKDKSVSGSDNSVTMEEIVSQCFIFFVAGFETTSGALTFALFELSRHPEIQDRLREEIVTVLGRHDDKLTYDSLSEMKYLEQVIDETMRTSPSVRILQRLCTRDYKVPGEDLVIGKGTRLFFSIPAVHWHEEYWENPNVFDPDRFEEDKRNMKQFQPFGQGPRMCIAERLGMMGIKVGLVCILRNFRVKLNNKTILPLKMSVKNLFPSAEGGIWLNLEKI